MNQDVEFFCVLLKTWSYEEHAFNNVAGFYVCQQHLHFHDLAVRNTLETSMWQMQNT